MIFALVVIVSVPIYFADDRTAAFDILPRNDHSPNLLARKGETGDGRNRQAALFPGAPMARRLRSVAVAFYYVLPHEPFTNIQASDGPDLRPTPALAFPGWIFMLMIDATARGKSAYDMGASLMAAKTLLVVIACVTAQPLVATKASLRRVDVLAALALLATAALIGTEFAVGRLVLRAFSVDLAVVAVSVHEGLCVRHDHA